MMYSYCEYGPEADVMNEYAETYARGDEWDNPIQDYYADEVDSWED